LWRPIDGFAERFLGLTRQELGWLAAPGAHMALLGNRRAGMILSRARLVAAVFALLTPLWILVDYAAFGFALWAKLALGRGVATAALAWLFFHLRGPTRMREAQRGVWLLFAIPTVFYLYSVVFLDQHMLHGFPRAVAVTHTFLPFLLLAGMSIFPLTAVEALALAVPILLANVWAGLLHWPARDGIELVGVFWLLLVAAVAMFVSMSQLAFIIALVRQAIRDPLTGCFSRRSGEELLELQFALARRSGAPFSVAFIDLDRFKQVNDGYGHEAGDALLRQTVDALSGQLRRSDILVRWGGEEFILIMPHTDGRQARVALERLRAAGLGLRPDGSPQTASIGVAERREEGAEEWQALAASADARMYRAKQAGRDRIVGCGA
jgi:diguanylate cyclase (GGDEF)-like protein